MGMRTPNVDNIDRIQKGADSASGKIRRVTKCMKTAKGRWPLRTSGKFQGDRNPQRPRRIPPGRPQAQPEEIVLSPRRPNTTPAWLAVCRRILILALGSLSILHPGLDSSLMSLRGSQVQFHRLYLSFPQMLAVLSRITT